VVWDLKRLDDEPSPGQYRIRLFVGGDVLEKPLRVRPAGPRESR
jgi:hypothetical protein